MEAALRPLLALAPTLRALDLSGNPLTLTLTYADLVLGALPGLKAFDGVDLDTFGRAYGPGKVTRTQLPPALPCELALPQAPRPSPFEIKLLRALEHRPRSSSGPRSPSSRPRSPRAPSPRLLGPTRSSLNRRPSAGDLTPPLT